jgi:hypothetical protein
VPIRIFTAFPRLSEDAGLFRDLLQLVACRAPDMATLGKQEAATASSQQLHTRLQTVTPDSAEQHGAATGG